jgi:hypothetical protein
MSLKTAIECLIGIPILIIVYGAFFIALCTDEYWD